MVATPTGGGGKGAGRELRKGYTTGACASAAAKAAAMALETGRPVAEVEIYLPAGWEARFAVARTEMRDDAVSCCVVKDAGDDPDVTNGAEVCATVSWGGEPNLVSIEGGQGVGMVTKPGLGLPVGEAAINPVPRQMIEAEVRDALGPVLAARGARVAVSVPRGETLARRTLNGRLGIVGGISILGTTGIVVPFSAEAYTATIAQATAVAAAAGCRELVLSTGRRTERFAQALLDLPEEAFVQMGDFVGFALEEAVKRGMRRATLCLMVGKLAKIAAGQLQTHVSRSRVDQAFLARVVAESGADPTTVEAVASANTSRHFAEIVQERGLDGVYDRLCVLAAESCRSCVDGKLDIRCLLMDFDGTVMGRAAAGE